MFIAVPSGGARFLASGEASWSPSGGAGVGSAGAATSSGTFIRQFCKAAKAAALTLGDVSAGDFVITPATLSLSASMTC